MKALTAKNVESIFLHCLFKKDEDTSNAIIVEGVVGKFGFHPDRLIEKKAEIAELLEQLPDNFKAESGGGWSFLNACMTNSGDQWGEHRNIEQLLTLGIATDQARILMPRKMWSMFPGGMPYFSVSVKCDAFPV